MYVITGHFQAQAASQLGPFSICTLAGLLPGRACQGWHAGMPARRWQVKSTLARVLSRRYMLEKTFMITPPEMISAIARMAGRSGFCL